MAIVVIPVRVAAVVREWTRDETHRAFRASPRWRHAARPNRCRGTLLLQHMEYIYTMHFTAFYG